MASDHLEELRIRALAAALYPECEEVVIAAMQNRYLNQLHRTERRPAANNVNRERLIALLESARGDERVHDEVRRLTERLALKAARYPERYPAIIAKFMNRSMPFL